MAEAMVSDLVLSREQFRMLYDNSAVPYFLMDDNGSISDPNKATLRFLHGTPEECGIANFFDLLLVDEKARTTAALLRGKVERSISVSNEELRVRALDGNVQWALVSIYSLDRSSPIPFKHLVTLVDVTSERESEQVKTDFLLLASHQLRTPATTIKWYVDYLLNTKAVVLEGMVREYLEEIYAANERMIDLLTTLLTISRIEMGTLSPEYGPVHTNELVDDILHELEPDIKKKDLRVDLATEGDDKIVTDRTMMRICIHNLLTNAVKYTPKDGTIDINTTFVANRAAIAVSDSGCGIPVADQEKIFTKMFRAANARKMSANGTGLGLSLTKAFVETLGGTIDFMSTEGKGTTFTIRLPRVAPGA